MLIRHPEDPRMKMIDSVLWKWMLRVLGFIDASQQVQLKKSKKGQALNYIYIVLRNGSRQSHSLVPIPGHPLRIIPTPVVLKTIFVEQAVHGTESSRMRTTITDLAPTTTHLIGVGVFSAVYPPFSIDGYVLFTTCLKASSSIYASCSGAVYPTHI